MPPALCLNLLNLGSRYPGGAPLLEQLDAAQASGVSLVGISASAIREHVDAGGSPACFAAELECRGLACFELLYLACDPTNPDATLGHLERLRPAVEALRPAWILTASPAPAGAPLADLLGRCCDLVAGAGCGLAFEFFPWAPIATLAGARELIAAAGRRNAGVLVDTWHFFHGPDDWTALETLPLDDVAYVQFSDAVAVDRSDLAGAAETSRRFPGDGRLDLARFAETFRRRGFAGTVSIEVLSAETRAVGPREFARRCVESTRRYWR
jgi:sugar phosphate isomerase/epimerase